MNFYTRVLNTEQKEVLSKFADLGKGKLYLAGGTALALQLGHRTSVDLDFYTPDHFDVRELSKKLRQIFLSDLVIKGNQSEDTFFAEIRGIKFSVFYYPYLLVRSVSEYRGVKIASVEDIAAMKIAAIVQRGRRRDFVDIHFLIKKIGLEKILKATFEKYPWYKDMTEIIGKSLNYFVDADNDKEAGGTKIFNPGFSWEKAKKEISREVRKYQQMLLNKV